jgi:hypothetical protein
MPDSRNETRNAAIAAAAILIVAGVALYFMPKIVLGLGEISPMLGFGAGVVIILGFFLIFWLRSRFRR